MPVNVKLYFDLVVGLLIAGLVVFAGWQYDQAKLARKDTLAAQAAMTQLQEGLAQLQRGQEADKAAVVAVAASQAVATKHAVTVRQRVVTMGNDDAKLQAWLDGAVPGTGCLLDDTCPANAAGAHADSVPASAVR